MYDIKEYMKQQPVINIGMIGHVANGKSSIVKKLTGKATQAFSSEKERNITIRLGYANAKIYKCNSCTPPLCYDSTPSNIYEKKCQYCNNNMELVTHVSFVDAPGHHLLTSTMLSGTCVMDYTILVESITNSTIPSCQTWEHMIATNIVGLENGLVCLNKIDMIPTKQKITSTINKLKVSIKDFGIDKNIIPISPIFDINMNVICEYIANLKIKEKNFDTYPIMICIRSFDANKPQKINNSNNIKGGIVGGSLIQGSFNIGDEIIIYPGYIEKDSIRQEYKFKNETFFYYDWKYYPIKTKILSINSEKELLQTVIPGGLVGIQLDVDPGFTRDDKLVGNMLLSKDTEHGFQVCDKIKIIIDNVFPDIKTKDKKKIKLYKGFKIKLNIYSHETSGFIIKYNEIKKHISIILDNPVIININSTKVILSDIKTNNILAKCSIINIRICNCI